MINHVHLIISSKRDSLAAIVRDLKKYTSKQIITEIGRNTKESRREWMLNLFGDAGACNGNSKTYQF